MSIIISVFKARLAALAIANAVVHVTALTGKAVAWADPTLVGDTFNQVATIVVLATGTLGLAFPGIKKRVEFTDTEGIVKS